MWQLNILSCVTLSILYPTKINELYKFIVKSKNDCNTLSSRLSSRKKYP